MKVLVTGSTGFVGGHLVSALIRAGHDVRCLHRHSSDLSVLEGLEVELQMGNVLNLEDLRSAVGGVDAVVHLVAIIREREATFEEVNVQGVKNLLRACRDTKPRIIHMGALGTGRGSRSRYSRSKAAGERLVRDSELPHTILRPSLILGPGGDFTTRFGSLIERYRKVPLIGPGESLLQPLYVGDVVKATIAALVREQGRVWDLVGPERVTWNELVVRVAQVAGLTRSIRHVPLRLARFVSKVSSFLSGEPLVTEDELILMQEDVYGDTKDFVDLTGDEPMALDDCLERAFGSGRVGVQS
ncbi:MAG: complex I NDUFA9 subunit family protein [Candidatus Thermoplasmatota archaeon]|nr:complex I NDUFA9 subunit family protein [Candidatus Thermoplasmatota archaeon]